MGVYSSVLRSVVFFDFHERSYENVFLLLRGAILPLKWVVIKLCLRNSLGMELSAFRRSRVHLMHTLSMGPFHVLNGCFACSLGLSWCYLRVVKASEPLLVY